MRRVAPVAHARSLGFWMLFDHDSVKRALADHAVFSSRAAPPGGEPLDWLIFLDPPRHSKLRALIARTFTPRAVADMEPRISAIAHRLLDAVSAQRRPAAPSARRRRRCGRRAGAPPPSVHWDSRA